MITYLPSYVVAQHVRGAAVYDGRQPRDYLPLYEHFARKVLDWNLPREMLIDTSGRGSASLAPLPSQEAAATVLSKLFVAAGTGGTRGAFLKRCGIKRWGDLAKPIRLKGRACTAQVCYDVRERRLNEPSPNSCHPGAVFAQRAYFLFGWDRKWRFVLCYGYSRDASSWNIYVRQGREALSTFIKTRVPQWLDDVLVPEAVPMQRKYRNRDHDLLSQAVDAVFSWDCYGPSPGTISTEALVCDLLTKHKPRLTKRRLGVLRKWMEAESDG